LELVEIVRPGSSYDVGRNTISDLTEDTNGKALDLASGGWVMSVRNPWVMSVRNDNDGRSAPGERAAVNRSAVTGVQRTTVRQPPQEGQMCIELFHKVYQPEAGTRICRTTWRGKTCDHNCAVRDVTPAAFAIDDAGVNE
jgi:hypothetical protein